MCFFLFVFFGITAQMDPLFSWCNISSYITDESLYAALHTHTIFFWYFPDGQRQFYHHLKIPGHFKVDLGED